MSVTIGVSSNYAAAILKINAWYSYCGSTEAQSVARGGNCRRLQGRTHGWSFDFLDDVAMQNIIQSECSVRE